MKKKSVLGLSCAMVLALSSTTFVSAEAESVEAETVTQEDGTTHLLELDGTYEQLFPVLLQEQYEQIWLDATTDAVGEDMAEDTVAMLQASVTGDLIGQEATEKYGYFGEGYAFYCGFTQDVDTITIDNGTVTTYDAEGEELSSHAYEFVSYDENSGFYNYQTTDADAGEFTYFCFGFDSPTETYHLEFRYGSDLDALNSWVEGDYAYWMASAISAGDDQKEMAKKAIELFVSENLSE